MPEDITTTLVNAILASTDQATDLQVNASIIGTSSDLLGAAADWAQILGTALGPTAQLFAIDTAKFWAAEQAAAQAAGAASSTTAAAEATAATAAASATAAIGVGVVVVILAFVLSAIFGGGDSSAQTVLFQDILNYLGVEAGLDEAIYWYDKSTGNIQAAWVSLSGDLDDLASQGTAGAYVAGVPATSTTAAITGDVANYHKDGRNFIETLIGTPLNWEVPLQAQNFLPWAVPVGQAPVAFGYSPWNWWYGPLPVPEGASDAPGSSRQDPRTMLSFLALGLQSYVALQSVSNIINEGLPTISEFVAQFADDLQRYLQFLYDMYVMAVQGIVKTAQPSDADRAGFAHSAWYETSGGNAPTNDFNLDFGPPPSPGTPNRPIPQDQQTLNGLPPYLPPTVGDCWNGMYGACETYPLYGWYPSEANLPPAPTTISGADLISRAYFVSSFDMTGAGAAIDDAMFSAGGQWYIESSLVYGWMAPWLGNRAVLGSIARWKALYIVNGYSYVWDLLISLQRLWLSGSPDPGNPPAPVVPAAVKLSDGTVADGNWHMRELFQLVNGDIDGARELIGSPQDPTQPIEWSPSSPEPVVLDGLVGYSGIQMAQLLKIIGSGVWSGPPSIPQGEALTGPFSLRQLIAECAR